MKSIEIEQYLSKYSIINHNKKVDVDSLDVLCRIINRMAGVENLNVVPNKK